MRRTELDEQIESADIPELKIEQDEIEFRVGGELLTRGAGGLHADETDGISEALHDRLKGQQHEGMVVNKQRIHEVTLSNLGHDRGIVRDDDCTSKLGNLGHLPRIFDFRQGTRYRSTLR